MPKPKLFISHISKETELAQFLKRQLSQDFLDFMDIFVSSDGVTLQAGTKWLDELTNSLGKAQIQIVLCSKESVGRPWVNFEAGACWIREILIIPICHSGMTPAELPPPLSMLQSIEGSSIHGLKALYETIARQFGMKTPSVNYSKLIAQIKQIESNYIQGYQSVKRIANPRILCAASEPYIHKGFERDVDIVSKAFPERVVVRYDLTAKKLRELLTSNPPFDIIHLVVAVDEDNGDLIFSSTDPITYKTVDRMSANGFADLVKEAQTSLVVLATCNSYSLAIEVAPITNMIAANKNIGVDEVAQWSDCFYDFLKKYSLYKAYDLTKNNSKAPLRLIRQGDVELKIKT